MRWTGDNKESSPVSGIREVVEVVGLLLQLLPCHPMPRSMTCPMNFLSCLHNILSGSKIVLRYTTLNVEKLFSI